MYHLWAVGMVCSGLDSKWRYLLTAQCTKEHLAPLSTDAASQVDAFLHDCDPIGMNDTQVGVLEEADKVNLWSFLRAKIAMFWKRRSVLNS